MSNIPLYLFLIAFVLIEIPIFSLIFYLYKRRGENGRAGKLRDVIFIVSAGYFTFILGEIVLVLSSLFRGFFSIGFIIALFTDTTLIVLVSSWYAFFKIRQLI